MQFLKLHCSMIFQAINRFNNEVESLNNVVSKTVAIS